MRLLVFTVLCALPMLAQQGRGTVQGLVTDGSGAAVAGASVRIVNTGTNVATVTETNGEGLYAATNLNVGQYSVSIEKSGFRKAVISGLTLQVDQRLQADARLDVGQVAEAIEVKAEIALVDTSGGSVGKVVENRRIVELPLNGRNALALTLLTPAVKSNAGPTNSGFADRGIQLSSISINGGPNSMNGQLLDGANNIQSYIGEVAINPGVDAVEEFKVQSGSLSAEFGFSAGGVINMVTKSGTNQLHGTVYHFLRNDKVDARNAFATTKPPFRYNQFGGSAGGPLVRDRTFLFGNWERYYFRRSTQQIGTFPTAQQRGGNFNDLLTATGQLIPVFDPASTAVNPAGQPVRMLFPGQSDPH